MQRLEVSGAVRPIYGSLGVKRLKHHKHLNSRHPMEFTGYDLQLQIFCYSSTETSERERL